MQPVSQQTKSTTTQNTFYLWNNICFSTQKIVLTRPQVIFYTSKCTMNFHKNQLCTQKLQIITTFLFLRHVSSLKVILREMRRQWEIPNVCKYEYNTSKKYIVIHSRKNVNILNTPLNVQYVRSGHLHNIVRSMCTSKYYIPAHKLKKKNRLKHYFQPLFKHTVVTGMFTITKYVLKYFF